MTTDDRRTLNFFYTMKSCAVNKNRLFLPFLSSVVIPPQVEKGEVLMDFREMISQCRN